MATTFTAYTKYNNELVPISKGSVPVGTILAYGGTGKLPVGYLLCNGASVSRTTFSALFDAIGTAYGSVDDNHFNLPDLVDKFVEGDTTTRYTIKAFAGASESSSDIAITNVANDLVTQQEQIATKVDKTNPTDSAGKALATQEYVDDRYTKTLFIPQGVDKSNVFTSRTYYVIDKANKFIEFHMAFQGATYSLSNDVIISLPTILNNAPTQYGFASIEGGKYVVPLYCYEGALRIGLPYGYTSITFSTYCVGYARFSLF